VGQLPRRQENPMTAQHPTSRSRRRSVAIVAAGILIVLVAAGGFGLWYLFLRPSGPAAVSTEALTLPSAASSSPLASGGLDGTWNVDTTIGSFSDSTDSFVGYRVQEQLAKIGANTAVGRTPSVSGTLTISGTQLTAATITGDLTALVSDDQRRDGQLVDHGIETASYPTAIFKLTSSIDLGTNPTDGHGVDVSATGQLTLHGQTRTVQIALKTRLSGSVIEVVGSLPIAFSDYGIQPPTSFAVLSVADQGTMELQLFFTHA
jgi:polyisoprenoid-binding protein YceI